MHERSENSDSQMKSSAGIPDLSTSNRWRAVIKARSTGRAAGTLSNVLVDFAVLIWAFAESLDRCVDESRVDFVDFLPRKSHSIYRTRRKILDQYVTGSNQALKDFFTFLILCIQSHGSFVVIQHCEIQAVHIRNVEKLSTSSVSYTGPLNFDYVCAKPGEQLCAGWTRLHMSHVQNTNSFQRFPH